MGRIVVAALGAILLVSSGCRRAEDAPPPAASKTPASTPASAPTPAPSSDPAQLEQRAVHRRAVEAVIWGMPAVNFELMYEATHALGGQWNQVLYWSRLPSWKNQTLTPNPDVIYLMPFYDTRQGPVVLEIPAADGASSITGSIDDGWQTALEDVGPAGVDQGKGGKYLLLPPGHDGDVPAGYIALPSSTYTGYALLRSNIGSGSAADIAKAADYGRRIRLYPLAEAGNPPETKFVDAIDADFDATIPYDQRFFRLLQQFVEREPWIARDRVMIDPLRSLGIQKGKPFEPDAATRQQLDNAIAEAHALLQARYDTAFSPYFEGSRWAVPASQEAIEGLQSNYANPDAYPVDARGLVYTYGFFSAKHLGQGQFYLMTIKDKQGQLLDGGSAYTLKVPAHAPVSLYWSATAYDRETHALIRGQKWASRASTTPGLEANADGSIDLHFGPTPPASGESNWVPTQAGRKFELLFRFYGPQKPLFDKAWVLPDVTRKTGSE
jgi:hypothetical protein